jgi:hypothetical protein
MILKIFRFSIILLTVYAVFTNQILACQSNDLIVHEWGTFTSIAGKKGVAIDWRPLKEKSDLPSFVYTSANKNQGLRGTYKDPGKGRLAKVRMETPVIYFYTGKKMDVDVEVSFPNGEITEWYPQAGKVNPRFESGITWGKIKLLPNETPNFLREVSYSHYYPARETDAVTVQVCNADKTKIEKEKFLFYRGIGNFDLPLAVKFDGKTLTLNNQQPDELQNLIVFENKGGKIGFRLVPNLSTVTTVERPTLNNNITQIFEELERVLVSQGLYPKEAKAMIKTWKDSWFEEGLRVFYVLPQMTTGQILPLKVEPKPKEIIRVLVGRTEVITPEMTNDVKKQVSLLRSASPRVRAAARKNLKEYGRFYEPILREMLAAEKNAKTRWQIQKLITQS